jgi:AcrR family transcriptional regulator
VAKPGASSRLEGDESSRSSATKAGLVEAAIETLKADGFTGASARAIAGRAGCNQALVFYHYGSVVNLLLAALDEVSASRLARYREAVAAVGSPGQLVDVATAIFREDLDAGHVTVLVEMMAGASATPGLGAEVAARIAPWTEFARQAIASTLGASALGSLIPPGDAAHGIVALYLGLELLTHLDGDRAPALALFDHAKQLVALVEALGGGFLSPSPLPKDGW